MTSSGEWQSVGSLDVKHISHVKNEITSFEYDLIILTSTWESRGKEAINHLSSQDITDSAQRIIYFESQDGEAQKLKKEFKEFAFGKLPDLETWDLESSVSVSNNFQEIRSNVAKICAEKGRPLKVFIDSSCLPKSYIIFLMGLAFKGGFISQIDVFYSEAEEYLLDGIKNLPIKTSLMSHGDWKLEQIPFFEGDLANSQNAPMIVSVGAEIKASIPLIERMEPESVSVISIDNFEERIPNRMADRETPFLKELEKVYGASLSKFNLVDCLGVIDFVAGYKASPVRCLAIGAKLHALAIGVAATQNRDVEVMCRIPTSYSLTDVKPSGINHIVIVRDRFDPQLY